MSQPSLFLTEPSASAPVAGFSYWPEAFTAAEERDWLHAIESLPFKPFEFHGYLGKRRIVSFGWHYDYSGRALRPSTPMPNFLEPLRARAAAVAGLDAALLQQALVTEYDAGVTIGWHRDKPMFEDVVALSFLSPCRLRLRVFTIFPTLRWARMKDFGPQKMVPRAAWWPRSVPSAIISMMGLCF